MRVREASVGGATFEMSCSVATENLREAGYSVLIQSQDSLTSPVRTIMTLSPDNVLQHGGATDPNRRYIPGYIDMSTLRWCTGTFWNVFIPLSLSLSTQRQSGSDKVWSGRVSVSPGGRPVVWQRFLLVRYHRLDQTAARTSLDQSHQRGVQQSQDRLSRKWWVKVLDRNLFLCFCSTVSTGISLNDRIFALIWSTTLIFLVLYSLNYQHFLLILSMNSFWIWPKWLMGTVVSGRFSRFLFISCS